MLEICVLCDCETGRAGAGDDSIYRTGPVVRLKWRDSDAGIGQIQDGTRFTPLGGTRIGSGSITDRPAVGDVSRHF